MRYVACGSLVVDCYYRDGKLQMVDGGGPNFNVIANLAHRGERTKAIFTCGSDRYAKIAISSLIKQGVQIQIKGITEQTRAYHILMNTEGHLSSKTCPICQKETWSESREFVPNLEEDDVLVLDGLRPENIPLLGMDATKVIDIGRTKRLITLSNDEIMNLLKRIEIMQLNERVEIYLQERLGENLYNIFKPRLLVVTRGRNGATFQTATMKKHKKLLYTAKEVDDTGAGDAFFSVVIQEYFNHLGSINSKWVNSTFRKANVLTSKVVANLGARGHLGTGWRFNTCLCD